MVIIALAIWILIASVLGFLLIRRMRRQARMIEELARPEYKNSTSIAEWERASNESLEWSRERRNKEIK